MGRMQEAGWWQVEVEDGAIAQKGEIAREKVRGVTVAMSSDV